MHPQFSTNLLRWYHAKNRDLPWRCETPNVYHVWLSEIMLQQTTFATVANRFSVFIQQYPTVFDLAQASQAEVLQHWAGLGYYARARNLYACAQTLVRDHQGIFPQTAKELQSLPGIGAYTAAAIACIAFNTPNIAVDSNVKRLFARLTRTLQPIAETDPVLHDFFAQSQAGHSARDHFQAWMDLGETICKARNPLCDICPVRQQCQGQDIAATLPIKKAKNPRKKLFANAYILKNDQQQAWLRRRPERGLFAGMLEVPTSAWLEQIPNTIPEDIPDLHWQDTATSVQHIFTHIELHVRLYQACSSNNSLAAFGKDSGWYDASDISGLGLPTLMKKILLAAPAAE